MKIVLTEITRLHGGKCCVAGICPESGQLYRLSIPSVTHEFAVGSEWQIGSELEGEFKRISRPEELVHREDSRWSARSSGRIAGAEELRKLFDRSLVASPWEALGIDDRSTPVECLRPQGRSIVTVRPDLFEIRLEFPRREGFGASIRADFCCNGQWMNYVPVNDIRFFCPDGIDFLRVRVAQKHAQWVQMGYDELFLRIGLTRPYDSDGTGERYWLQIDGVHFFSKDTGEYVHNFACGSPF